MQIVAVLKLAGVGVLAAELIRQVDHREDPVSLEETLQGLGEIDRVRQFKQLQRREGVLRDVLSKNLPSGR